MLIPERFTDRVAIVGMAHTTRHLAPFDDESWEVWGLNESYAGKNKGPGGEPFMRRASRWFQMHPRWDFARLYNFNDSGHVEWLKANPDNPDVAAGQRWEGMPIYMLEQYDDIPGSVAYPLDEVRAMIGVTADTDHPWLTSTPAQMMALAVLMDFKEIGVYGIEMSSQTEFSEQRLCWVFWAGFARGRGIKVTLPPGSNLMGFNEQIYGYEKTPGYTAMHAEIFRNSWKSKMEKAIANVNKIRGEKQKIMDKLNMGGLSKGKKRAIGQELQEVTHREINALIELNSFAGAYQALDAVHRQIKDLPTDKTELAMYRSGPLTPIQDLDNELR